LQKVIHKKVYFCGVKNTYFKQNEPGLNKKKIFNDPIYGFITIPHEIVFDLIEHPFFQRLRRIRQLGLTYLVYPGALHTRFHHALGAMHIMCQAIEVIRSKGHTITEEEAKAVIIAILLHDIGHGPFSHSLESSIVSGISHEELSGIFMSRMNEQFGGQLTQAIRIFRNEYEKKFLHQLVSSQLDMDRLDYLKRDSFYTGVSEGVINSDRIITMLDVKEDTLVIEAKGIYSIEKFIIARRLMYWQVYLHKTVIASESLLMNILRRARQLAMQGVELFATPSFRFFLYNTVRKEDFLEDRSLLAVFADLDDNDVYASIKVWQNHEDKVLSVLCRNLLERRLYRVEIHQDPFPEARIGEMKEKISREYGLTDEEADYFVFTGTIANNAYNSSSDKINILYRDKGIVDIAEAADQLNISVLSRPVTKHYLCHPKENPHTAPIL
jgi:uncharacterized protein